MNTLRTFVILFLSIFVSCTFAHAEQIAVPEELRWKYAEFVYAFGEKNWNGVCRFVSSATKAGFGPNEDGCEGVKQVYSQNNQCWDEIMFALRQGCKSTSAGEGVTCVAPPQLSDVYLGARAGFTYNRKTKKLIATALICGGD